MYNCKVLAKFDPFSFILFSSFFLPVRCMLTALFITCSYTHPRPTLPLLSLPVHWGHDGCAALRWHWGLDHGRSAGLPGGQQAPPRNHQHHPHNYRGTGSIYPGIPQYTSVFLSIPQYPSVFLSIPQYTPVYSSIPQYTPVYLSIPQYTSVYSSIPQYTPVYSSIPQYTPVYSSIPQYTPVFLSILSTT